LTHQHRLSNLKPASRHSRLLRLAVLLLVCCAPPAASLAGNNCTGGGRPRPDDGGVGGTGDRPTAPDEGGIGGTGISTADTGIIGTITGFASICVDGMEIHYGADTAVDVDGRVATSAQLAVGQVVEVVANGTGSEVRARQVTVRHVLSGPVTRVDPERSQIDVMGQPVQLLPTTRAGGGDGEVSAVASAFAVDSVVRVSGMRQSDGVVVASRVTRSETDDVVQVTGPVTKLDPGVLAVAGTPVRTDAHVQAALGDEVHVEGRWNGAAIVAQSVESLPRIPFDGRVDRLAIEGYARPSVPGQLRVGSFVVELPQAAAAGVMRPPAPDAHIQIEAVVRDRHVIVERLGEINDLPMLPPPPEREPGSWNGGASNDFRRSNGGDPPPIAQQPLDEDRGLVPPPRQGGEMTAPGIPDLDDAGAPSRPDVAERPPVPPLPDRPAQMPDSPPQIPDRPSRPERPPRPDRAMIPDRPPRPDIHGRP
jgi:hypothetical protein